MVRERIPAYSPVKHARIIRVLAYWTKIKHPKVIAVPMLQELFRVFASVTIQPLDADCRISHDDNLVGDVCEVWKKVNNVKRQTEATWNL